LKAPQRLGPAETIPATRETAALFDQVAPRYDLLNRLMSLGQDRRWRARLVGAAGRGRVLDLGCGTGDVALALAAAGARPVGLDPSPAMLRRARAKAPHLDWVLGDALRLPFKAGVFAASTSAFVLRNLPDRPACFAEQARVLRPGGRATHLELVRPERGWQRVLHALYVKMAVPAFGRLSSSHLAYRYLSRTVLTVPPPEVFAAELGKAGLRPQPMQRMALGGVALVVAEKR
jgi:demethylmenaquinone methyltransferase/2-methoxy-6-polyprenyl-1,4-benzoquinol methylase